MAIYSVANRTSSGTAASPAQENIASSAVAYRLLEFGITQNGPTASVFGLGRPAAIGVTPTSPVTVLAEDQGNNSAGNTTTALAWGTAPTVPANFFRRVSLPATVGAGIIWTFPRGIIVLKSNTSVLWVIATAAVADTWLVVDE
jgi:hypothetical protein